MAAQMWRVPVSKAHRGASFSVLVDRGALMEAEMAHDHSTGRRSYVFSDLGVGRRDLALIGQWHEVGTWLAARSETFIVNKVKGVSGDIFMGACFYKPGHRYKGLFPLHDAGLELFKGVMSIGMQCLGEVRALNKASGHAVNEMGGAVREGVQQVRRIFGGAPKSMDLNSTEVYLRFSYLPSDGHARLQKVGNGAMSLASLTVPALEMMKGL